MIKLVNDLIQNFKGINYTKKSSSSSDWLKQKSTKTKSTDKPANN
jgi:ribonuclease D